MSKSRFPLILKLILLVFGPLVGLICLRLIFVQPPVIENTHYHADFAIYIYDQQLDLDQDHYYVGSSQCQTDSQNDPLSRAHLHSPNPGLVHVHDQAVTWSHFFSNLGFELTDSKIRQPIDDNNLKSLTYESNQDYRLRFILNGNFIHHPSAKVIGNKDRLLIDYGNASEASLKQRFNNVGTLAAEANLTDDPAGCFGGQAVSFNFWDRFKQALQFWR